MDVSVWVALFIIFMSGGLTPGPAVMLVVSTSLKYGFRSSMFPAIGVSMANLVWIGLAAGGIATLATAFPVLFLAVKYIGIAFILWLAFGLLRQGAIELGQAEVRQAKSAKLLLGGIGLQMANPNALIFFGLILPTFFVADRPLLPQVAITMVTVTITEMLGLALYGRLADFMSQRYGNPKFARRANAVVAILMLAAAGFALMATLPEPV
ncbi:MAG: LysE family translocator [Henriciella sp.]